jgi:hypothetical protein
VFLMNYRRAWNDYFPGTYANNPNSQTYDSRQTPSGTSVYVSNCLFISITSTSNGGALYLNSVTYFLVESSSFYSCKTSDIYSGAIYLSNNGQCVLHEVCGYDCCSTHSSPYFQFAQIQVNNAISNKNYVNYSSIVRCISDKSSSYGILRLHCGKICCPSVNISLNKCHCRTIYCDPFYNSNSVTCLFSYSSFADNNSPDFNCIYLATEGAKYEIKSCNILRNTQSSTTYGTIFVRGNLMIADSCILENNASRIFYQESSSYTITLSNCTADKTTYNQKLVIQSTVTKSFILALNHISTQNCHVKYDAVGALTPIIQSPSSSKKPIHCYTCGDFLCQSRLRYLISLISVFIFNIVHLDSSIDP